MKTVGQGKGIGMQKEELYNFTWSCQIEFFKKVRFKPRLEGGEGCLAGESVSKKENRQYLTL